MIKNQKRKRNALHFIILCIVNHTNLDLFFFSRMVRLDRIIQRCPQKKVSLTKLQIKKRSGLWLFLKQSCSFIYKECFFECFFWVFFFVFHVVHVHRYISMYMLCWSKPVRNSLKKKQKNPKNFLLVSIHNDTRYVIDESVNQWIMNNFKKFMWWNDGKMMDNYTKDYEWFEKSDETLTTGELIRHPVQLQLDWCTVRIPLASNNFKLFPWCRILRFQSFADSRPLIYWNSFGVNHISSCRMHGPLLPWQKRDRYNSPRFSPHSTSSSTSPSAVQVGLR